MAAVVVAAVVVDGGFGLIVVVEVVGNVVVGIVEGSFVVVEVGVVEFGLMFVDGKKSMEVCYSFWK